LHSLKNSLAGRDDGVLGWEVTGQVEAHRKIPSVCSFPPCQCVLEVGLTC